MEWNEDGQYWRINSDQTLNFFIDRLKEMYAKHHYLEIQWQEGKKRSHQQNNALHLWCAMLAKELNDAGHDFQHFFEQGADIPWTKMMVKELIWKPVQKIVTEKSSTAEAHKTDYIEVYEILNRHLAESKGVSVPWPNR